MDKNIHVFYHNSIVGTKITILNNLVFHHETCYIFSKQKYNNIKKKIIHLFQNQISLLKHF